MKLKNISQESDATVAWVGAYGPVCRSRVTPFNPRTQKQTDVRCHFACQAHRFGQLTEEQREAWNAAAAKYRSRCRQGQSGPLTGLHLFVRVNCKLALFGLEPLNSPPRPPLFPKLAPGNLVITNTAGVIKVKLVCRRSPGAHTVLRASPPQSPGVSKCSNFRVIGLCPAPVDGLADITALYIACFGTRGSGGRSSCG